MSTGRVWSALKQCKFIQAENCTIVDVAFFILFFKIKTQNDQCQVNSCLHAHNRISKHRMKIHMFPDFFTKKNGLWNSWLEGMLIAKLNQLVTTRDASKILLIEISGWILRKWIPVLLVCFFLKWSFENSLTRTFTKWITSIPQ